MKLFKQALLGMPWESSYLFIRTMKLKSSGSRSHYDALGITPSATQEDIKNAYYKLSKMYHPDRNKGSEEAAKHFRTINDAYEILGNYRKRKLYDKGIPTGGNLENQGGAEDLDKQTKFYRSRGSTPTGKTPIYDFDEWSRVHYAATFKRSEDGKEKKERKTQRQMNDIGEIQKETIIYFGIALCLISALLHFKISNTSYDEVSVPDKKKNS